MGTRAALIAETAAELSLAGFTDPRRHARRLVASALAISPADLFGYPDHAVEDREALQLRRMLDRIIAHEPLSRILGRREFWGLEFRLCAATFDPRPETETIIEAVLRREADRDEPLRLLDLGTGTGCILLALLREFPAATGVGIDIVESVVRMAAGNAVSLGLRERALFFVGDWGTALSGSFDAIVANPPYIPTADLRLLPPEVAGYDPWLALDGGADGLTPFRVISAALPKLLAPDGIFVTEIGVDQANAVAAIIKTNGLALEGIKADLGGNARCVVARRGDIRI